MMVSTRLRVECMSARWSTFLRNSAISMPFNPSLQTTSDPLSPSGIGAALCVFLSSVTFRIISSSLETHYR